MTVISIRTHAGAFAENKDIARELRLSHIMPALLNGESVTLDFTGVSGATQSFVHALLSAILRQYGSEALDKLVFKGCTVAVQKIIEMVTEYLQESWS